MYTGNSYGSRNLWNYLFNFIYSFNLIKQKTNVKKPMSWKIMCRVKIDLQNSKVAIANYQLSKAFDEKHFCWYCKKIFFYSVWYSLVFRLVKFLYYFEPKTSYVIQRLHWFLSLTHFMPLISFDTPWKHQRKLLVFWSF